MTQKHVALGDLSLPPGTNPRRSFDKSRIAGLAESIKQDGVLQNLVVEKNGDGKYHIRTGKRRYLALKLLKKKGIIDDGYKVPVSVKSNLAESDARRIATVENVQREPLEPLDEAEAFASLVSDGVSLDDVAAKTGVSVSTIRRRLALAQLSKEAKDALQKGVITLSLAEALTLATETQQHFFLNAMSEGASLDADEVRRTILTEKPSLAMAIFPPERYTGTLTTDLFANDASTYFDDFEEFMRLQEEAVEAKAERYRKKQVNVEVLHEYRVSWWQYREAVEGEQGTNILNLSPAGHFEMRKNLVKAATDTNGPAHTKQGSAPSEKLPYGPSLYRYVSTQRSMALLGAMLGNPRKRKEVAATLLLTAHTMGSRIRLDLHPSLRASAENSYPKGYQLLMDVLAGLSGKLGLPNDNGTSSWPLTNGHDSVSIYGFVTTLGDSDLDDLLSIVPLLTFGQSMIEKPEPEGSLFLKVYGDLAVKIREWWTPDEAFLAMLSRDELEKLAVDCGANYSLGRFAGYKKKELVSRLAAYFERTAQNADQLSEYECKGTEWVPGMMLAEPDSAGQN